MPLSWPAAGRSSFVVYIFKLLEQIARVGTSDTGPEGSRFEPGYVKGSFFKGHGRHVHFFLLLPNDTGAPCLGGIHSATSLN